MAQWRFAEAGIGQAAQYSLALNNLAIGIVINASVLTVGTVTGAVPALVETGVLDDANDLNVASTGTLPIGAGSTIDNSGVITNDGTITDGRSSGEGAGTIDNTGTIINDGTITGDGQGADGGLLITGNNYALNFNVNGGPGTTPTSLNVLAPTVADSQQSLPTPPVPTGYIFTGWFTAASGGTQVSDGTNLVGLLPAGPSSTTLYAQYGALQTTTQASPAWATYNAASTQNVTLTATVTNAMGPVNEGTVTFGVWDGPNAIVGSALSVPVTNGTATVSYPLSQGLGAGSYTVKATYSDPTGDLESSADDTQSLTIGAVPTTTTGNPTSFTYAGGDTTQSMEAWVTSPLGAPTEGGITWDVVNSSGQTVDTVGAGPLDDGLSYTTRGNCVPLEFKPRHLQPRRRLLRQWGQLRGQHRSG